MSHSTGRAFDHVVIIMFENEYRSYVMENSYMAGLASQGIDMANYFGVSHPSHTNYLASISGEIWNTTEDPLYNEVGNLVPTAIPPTLGGPTVVDRLASSGLSWNAYMESLYTVDWPPTTDVVMATSKLVDLPKTVKHTILDYPPYLNIHNPFVRFETILENRDQWERIGTAYDLLRDVLDGTLPEYAWLTPDIWSDGHWLRGSFSEGSKMTEDPCFVKTAAFPRETVLVNQLAKWLKTFFSVLSFPGPESRLPPRTLVVVTFDEADFNNDSYEGPNQIYTVLLGDTIEAGGVEKEGYNHYSLLRTIEKNFGLDDLGKNDSDANWLRFLWGQRFQWSPPQETPITAASGVLAAAGFEDALFVVYGDEGGGLSCSTYASGSWSAAQLLPVQASAVKMAVCGDELILVFQADGGLSTLTYTQDGGWSTIPQSIVSEAPGCFAVTAFIDYGDQIEKLMLAYRTVDYGIQSMIYSQGQWGDPVEMSFETDGDIVLASIGPSLYLIHKAMGTYEMNVVSYNTADFNVVTDETSRDVWAPSEYPVAFLDSDQPPYQGGAPLAAAALDGVIHLAHPRVGESQVRTETFSIAGVMTAETTSSSSYGTLAEVGWSPQTAIAGVQVGTGGAMSMSRVGSMLALLFQSTNGENVQIILGGYSN